MLYKGNTHLYDDELLEASSFSADITKLNFKNLYENGFIKVNPETEFQDLFQNRIDNYRYTLSQKGLKCLYDNKLLDQT